MMDISAQTSYSDVERWCNDFAYQFIMGQEAETLANIACVDSRNDYCIDLFKAISARTHISRLHFSAILENHAICLFQWSGQRDHFLFETQCQTSKF